VKRRKFVRIEVSLNPPLELLEIWLEDVCKKLSEAPWLSDLTSGNNRYKKYKLFKKTENKLLDRKEEKA
jgi:hypothetical protein